jgi:leucyl-tRNA synthetase
MSGDTVSTEHLHVFLRLLNPFAPHLTEELNARLQAAFPSLPTGQLCQQTWPVWDPAALVVDEIDIIVQVNGKLRDKLTVAPDCPKDELEARALQAQKAKPHLEGLTIRKVIVVPGKLVNIVAN